MSVALAETAAWLDLLYSRAKKDAGKVVVISASKRNVIGTFATDGDSLVRCASLMQENEGCYVKVNLMDTDAMARRGSHVVGNRSEVKTIVSFHCDVDAGKGGKYPARGTALWAINQMPLVPTLIINSNGNVGGFHAYWVLKQPYTITDEDDRKRVQDISKAWQGLLRQKLAGMLDNTSNLDRVLRCVNVKRCDGGDVTAHTYNVECEYSMEDFKKWLISEEH
jgi:hypothetical protein